MRIRTLLIGALLAGGLMLGLASPALAQAPHGGPEPVTKTEGKASAATTETLPFNPENISFADKEIFECFEKQVKLANPDFVTCSKAPSPILPATSEIVWASLAFAILLGFFIWKGYPAVQKGMDGRTERIRADLARADEAKAEAEGVLATYQAQVAASKGEATRIIEDARKTAEATKADLHKRAEAEIAEMRQRAAADIEASKVQAIADLKGEVAELAIGAAEAIVHNSLDQATQVQLVENYINTVGSRN